MVIQDLRQIGNKLYELRKRKGYSRLEVAEKAGLSDRTYADIERGSVNMRLQTLLSICCALGITPDAILTEEKPVVQDREALMERLDRCTASEAETSLKLLSTYLDSIHR